MVYIGRIGGPRTSDILRRIRPESLGLEDQRTIQDDIEWEAWAEMKNSVVPAYVDQNGKPYYRFVGNKTVIYRFRRDELELLGSGFQATVEPLPQEYEVV